MKNIAIIIAVIATILASILLEVLLYNGFFLYGSPLIIIITFGGMIMLNTNYEGQLKKHFLSGDLKQLKKHFTNSKYTYLFNQFSIHELKLVINILLQNYDEVKITYRRFEHLNELEQYHTSYIYQLYYLLINDVDKFLELKSEYNKTKTKVVEDNIKTKIPGKVMFHKQVFDIDFQVLDDIYRLYKNGIEYKELDKVTYKENIYNYIKEKALYYYLYNIEQHKEQYNYWEKSDFIFDEFLEEQQ